MTGLVTILATAQDDFTRLLVLEVTALGARAELVTAIEDCPPSACLLIDLDTFTPPGTELAPRRIGYAKTAKRADFPVLVRPFPMASLRALLTADEHSAALQPSADFRTVTLGTDTVRLSEREAALLAALYRAGGAPVSREELAANVFPDAKDPADAVTVYIHYLRKKLERSGRRVIGAHRGSYSLLCD